MRTYPDRGLHGRAVRDVGLRIVRGELPPGATLSVDDLGEEFDVSRTVIRESLKVLAGKGLVDARPKRGTFVRDRADWNLLDPDVLQWQFHALPDLAALAKLAELRWIVEPAAAALAAERRDDDDLAALEEAFAGLRTADGEEPVDADIAFHTGLLRATHNELVVQLVSIIDVGLRARDDFVSSHEVPLRIGVPAHRRVLAAVRGQDPGAARAAMTALLETATRDVRRAARTASRPGGRGATRR